MLSVFNNTRSLIVNLPNVFLEKFLDKKKTNFYRILNYYLYMYKFIYQYVYLMCIPNTSFMIFFLPVFLWVFMVDFHLNFHLAIENDCFCWYCK